MDMKTDVNINHSYSNGGSGCRSNGVAAEVVSIPINQETNYGNDNYND